MAPRLTKPLLKAMEHALNAALAGEGFDGGDFDGEDRAHYERALEWVKAEAIRRTPMVDIRTGKPLDERGWPC